MRRLRWSVALAAQAGAHRLLLPSSPSEHGLSPSQQAMFMAISVGLVISAGLMSGLTLGLMSMDLVELEVLKRSGTSKEQKYASAIMPIVSNQHFLLVTLLLCNAMAMEALPLFLDRLADPVTAILISVTAVLVFGEVLPQAVCSRYGLAIGYYCAWLVRLLMAATSPISWPIGKLLDFLLGSEHRALFRRGQLKALVDIHGADEGLGGNLTEDEIKVICGALDLTSKTARKSMTPLNKVFMLPADARLNQQTMRAILASGHSRIPVYTRGDRSSIIGLILVKELLQYKTHQEVPVSDVRMRSLPRLPADTPMYDMLKLFQTGRSHMVVLTDTPATARAAAEAAVKAAAKAAAEAAAAAAAEASSDSSDNSGGGSPLASMLRGRKRKSKRLQFESPLLQPIEQPEEEEAVQANPQQQQPQQQSGQMANGCTTTAAQLAEPFTGAWQQSAANATQLAESQSQQQADPPSSSDSHRVLQHSNSSGSRSKGRVAFCEQPNSNAASLIPPAAQGAAISDSSSSLAQLQEQQQQPEGMIPLAADRRSSSGGGSGSNSQKGSGLRTRSKSGPMLLSLAMGPDSDSLPDICNGPEGVAVPIGIITIEDVIEELMQAEIVDETDLFVDNERSITVNTAALAQSLPDQLRIALQSPQHQVVVAGMTGALVGAATTAGTARSAAGTVTVRKIFRQRSSSALAPSGGSGAAAAAVAGAGGGGGSASGSWSGNQSADGAGTPAGHRGGPPGALVNAPIAIISSGGGSSGRSTGVVAAVSAGLAAAAAAVVSGGNKAADGKEVGTERLPLLSTTEQVAAAHNR